MILCSPIRRHASTHHARRHAYHARRIAATAISKPAIVGYTCIVIAGVPLIYKEFTPIYQTPVVTGFSDIEYDYPLLSPSPYYSSGPSASSGTDAPPAESLRTAATVAAGTPIPEPSTLVLLLPAMFVMFGAMRCQKK